VQSGQAQRCFGNAAGCSQYTPASLHPGLGQVGQQRGFPRAGVTTHQNYPEIRGRIEQTAQSLPIRLPDVSRLAVHLSRE
jgi:hypothetical protein